MTVSSYYKYSRLPRKLKKRVNKVCGIHRQKDINSNLWYYLGVVNVKYRDYLINTLCKE